MLTTDWIGAAGAEVANSEDAIVVIGERRGEETVSVLAILNTDEIARADAGDLGDALRLAPGIIVRKNSRGETLPFFPGSGERETTVFLNAAPLNIAWDNRVDLAVLPAAAVNVRLARGTGATSAGARSSAGRINVEPALPDEDAFETLARAEVATGPAFNLESAARFRRGAAGALLAVGFHNDAGGRVADKSRTPFSQDSDRLRTNDDLERVSVLAHGALALGGAEIEASLLFSDAAKGAPPESDRDPANAAVRYWRYPRERLFVVGLESEWHVGDATSLGASVFTQNFDQRIDSYASQSYARLVQSQEDRNDAIGGRVFVQQGLWRGASLTVDGALSRAGHQERAFNAGAIPGAFEQYREVAASAGGALNAALPMRGRVVLRAGVDHLETPETAGRARQDDFIKPFAGLELAFALGGDVRLGGQVAWKSRPPTLRELYGVALDRFLPNADLRPETALYAEMNAAYSGDRIQASIIGFARDVDDTLEQRSVTVAGRSLRQRINLEGSTSYGAIATARARLSGRLALAADATLVHERPKGSAGPARLSERPSSLATARLEYARGPVAAQAEIERFGGVYSLDGAGAPVALDAGTFVNFRASYSVSDRTEIYLRIDNAFDAFYEPQAGLPADGRRMGVGLRLGPDK